MAADAALNSRQRTSWLLELLEKGGGGAADGISGVGTGGAPDLPGRAPAGAQLLSS